MLTYAVIRTSSNYIEVIVQCQVSEYSENKVVGAKFYQKIDFLSLDFVIVPDYLIDFRLHNETLYIGLRLF